MWSRLRGCVGSPDESRYAAHHDAAAAPPPAPRPRKYRFAVGDRVSACCADGAWHVGTVVAEDWLDPWRPTGSKRAPYQIRLDNTGQLGGMLVCAAKDSDKLVRGSTPVREMPVKELRQLVSDAGLTCQGCIEKHELWAKGAEAVAAVVAKAAAESAANRARTAGARFAGLDCILYGDDAHAVAARSAESPPHLVVLMLHGLGATNDQFLPLCDSLSAAPHFAAARVLYVLPAAPRQGWGVVGRVQAAFTPGGQWWDVDMVKLTLQLRKGEQGMARLLRERPRGMRRCREQMEALLTELTTRCGVPASSIVFSGFSQGAITAMDAALALPRGSSLAGVVMMSGSAMVIEEWHERLPLHPGLPVLLTHGTADRTLPFAAAGWCRELLTRGGATVHFVPHHDGHTVGPPHVLAAIAMFIASLLPTAAQSPPDAPAG